MKLAGPLIWYKDQVLRSLSYEALEEEVAELRELLRKRDEPTIAADTSKSVHQKSEKRERRKFS